MCLNFLKSGRFLLTAGLLAVLAQGLWEFPSLQDYLVPDQQMTAKLRSARGACHNIENDLTSLRERVDYLKWFLADNGPDQKFSAHRMLAWPFSEPLRCLSPGYSWDFNLYLAKQTQVHLQNKLKLLGALLQHIDLSLRARSPQPNTAILPKNPAGLSLFEQIQACQGQWLGYNAKLSKLTDQLTEVVKDGHQKQPHVSHNYLQY
jgi:hypothetical protein